MSRHSRLFLFLKNWVFLPLVVLCLPLLVLLGQEVYRDLKLLRSADIDSVQWTLSQVEIEYLDFLLTLERASSAEDHHLSVVRKDFDILYSRVGILGSGMLFAPMREIDGFSNAVTDVKFFLDQSTTAIDGSDADLQAYIPELQKQANALRPQIRSLFVQGLEYFASQSDQRRLSIFTTLTELAIISVTILIALGALSFYSMYANAQAQTSARALARTNAHMQTILSTTHEAVIVADTRGKIVDLNTAAETTFGYSLAEAKNQSIGDLIVPPEHRKAHAQGFARLVKTGQSRLVGKGSVHLEALKADGTRISVELAMQSAKTDDGEVFIGFLRDISQQLEVEAEIRAARDQALAGEQAKANFLAVMSHEIRTPLNGLLGNLTLISKTQLDKEQAVFAENMEISGRQLMHHVNSILDIAKFESGKATVSHTNFHLGRFLQDIVDSQSGHAGRNQTSIEWEWLGTSLDWVNGDKIILEQIMLNLVGNAIKFTHGGRMSIEAEQLLPPDGGCNVEIRIIDSGIGISEEDQLRIFEDFETCDSTYTRDGGGTGLGLAIVKRMVQLLGGQAGVESTLGEGSVFWLRLPFLPVMEPDESDGEERVKPTEQSLSILIAEDIETNAFVALKLLERDGHKVTIVKDGLSAVARAKVEVFDVILMDISMPRMDGLQATQEIRKAPPPFCDVPILAFSANVLPEETDHFRASGMDGFIGKPLQLSELRRALQAVLDNTLSANLGEEEPAVDDMAEKAQDVLNQSEYDIYLKRFIDEGAAFMETLAVIPLGGMDFTEIVSKAHQIRSTASLFGADNFATSLGNLEQEAKQSNEAACLIEIANLSEIWLKTRMSLDPNYEAAPSAE
ncbi:hybrid sensor histidine kinase/response regulator [Sedimentitalea sp. CY04]|uniref:histidine kinase n=1 Tax=Parasedimentitalea denitrificans TaxID=2211118 RepID=A0ABX0W3F6_9RHOB|nr:ATP-binding protein [Sedimentitalea sp. CY04]NIZ60176.1 hybrid sensor histidine kinase/response regulator [Sedimentitalea sp. CY04]